MWMTSQTLVHRRGTIPNAVHDGQPVLWTALRHGHHAVLQVLLDRGATPATPIDNALLYYCVDTGTLLRALLILPCWWYPFWCSNVVHTLSPRRQRAGAADAHRCGRGRGRHDKALSTQLGRPLAQRIRGSHGGRSRAQAVSCSSRTSWLWLYRCTSVILQGADELEVMCSCVARLAGIPLLGTRAMTALQRACINGATGLVKILLDAGADCNIIGGYPVLSLPCIDISSRSQRAARGALRCT